MSINIIPPDCFYVILKFLSKKEIYKLKNDPNIRKKLFLDSIKIDRNIFFKNRFFNLWKKYNYDNKIIIKNSWRRKIYNPDDRIIF